ncbi:MAG: protoporphyrinogen oxidase [Vulcanimicrobiota bacterium]
MLDVIVIGGGISGLTTAWRAMEAGLEVCLLESSSRSGGVIGSLQRPEGLLELGPDSLLVGRPSVRTLLEDLNLLEQAVSPLPSRPWMGRRGHLYPLPEGFRSVAPTRLLPFVRTPLLSWWGKFRMLWDLVLPASPLTDQTLSQLIGRRFGREALEQLAQPLIGGIYAADPDRLSLAATMPHLLALEKEHGSLIRGLWKSSAAPPKMSSLPEGLGQLTNTLARNLGNRIQTSCPVRGLQKVGDHWQLEAQDQTFQARQVVVATGAHHCTDLLSHLDSNLACLIRGIVCRDIGIVNLLYRADQVGDLPPGCQGFLLPLKENSIFSAASLTQQKWPDRIQPSVINFRLHLGGAGRESFLSLDDETLLHRAAAELTSWVPVEGRPLYRLLTRHPRAMPEYRQGHLELIRRVESHLEGMPGLHLVGNWLSGVGISECVARAEGLLPRLTEFARSHSRGPSSSRV